MSNRAERRRHERELAKTMSRAPAPGPAQPPQRVAMRIDTACFEIIAMAGNLPDLDPHLQRVTAMFNGKEMNEEQQLSFAIVEAVRDLQRTARALELRASKVVKNAMPPADDIAAELAKKDASIAEKQQADENRSEGGIILPGPGHVP